MPNILFLSSSLMAENSNSRRIATELVASIRAAQPSKTVKERHLSPDTMPHLTLQTLGALGKPADQRSKAEQDAARFADGLIEEVEAADVIVIAAPMYNFSIPSTLKAWLDHVVRAGRTFRYTASGPEGLLSGKKVYVVASRGGYYTGESPARGLDFQEPYLRTILGFIGLKDVSFIHVEGLAIGAEAAAKSLGEARAAIDGIFARAA